MNDKQTAAIVWIDGQAYTPNHPKAKAFANRQLMAGLGGAEPQHREVQTLARSLPQQTERKESPRVCSVLIVRYGRKRLDSDNLAASYKALRDAIAETLTIDDGDLRIEWSYEQIMSRTTGTHVLITVVQGQGLGL